MAVTGELWWDNVPNACGYIKAVVENVKSCRSVMCCTGSDVMWQKIMTDRIHNALESKRELHYIDMADEEHSPGEILFCKVKPELKSAYRSSLGYEKFFAEYAERTVLIDKYIVIDNCSFEQIDKWCSFISGYCTEADRSKGKKLVFVIYNKSNNIKKFAHICNMNLDEYIRKSDTKIMCTLVASRIKDNATDTMKEYISELAFSLSKGDAELAAELIDFGEKLAEDPESIFAEVVGSRLKSNGEHFKKSKNITKLIWQPQVRVYFPIIEKSRLDIIERNEYELSKLQDVRDIYGNVADTIYDIELGTLKHFCDLNKISISKCDSKKIKFLRDCRNILAHCMTINYSDLKKIDALL